jgi:alpha-L-rhamnosidase
MGTTEEMAYMTALKVDGLENPLGIDSSRPQFSWQLVANRKGARQSAFRIVVASSEANVVQGIADVWDSGRVTSGQSIGVSYGGPPLLSRARYHWRVEVSDEDGVALRPSPGSWWEMGLLAPADWTAHWIVAEDEIAASARRHGMTWVWGKDSSKACQFRLVFDASDHSPAVLHVLSLGGVERIGLNGAEIFTPERRGPLNLTANEPVKLTLNARRGRNLLTVVAAPGGNYVERFAGLAGILSVRRGDDEPTTFVTGDSGWEVADIDADPGASKKWQRAKPIRVSQPPRTQEPSILLRRSFRVEKPIERARLYITALGAYEPRLNGNPVGDAVLAPESTDFRRRVLYRTYDVTALLRAGENVLAAEIGDGWYAGRNMIGVYSYGPPPKRLIAQLEITYKDGTEVRVETGSDWRTHDGPVLENGIYEGEVYDARLRQAGWDDSGFDDSLWPEAAIGEPPKAMLAAPPDPPIRRQQVMRPVSVREVKPDVHVFDFGQNFAGWCRLRLHDAAPGQTIELRFAEILGPSGEIDQSNLRTALACVIYIASGEADEIHEPKFTFFGFRYVQVTGLSGKLPDDVLEGVVLHTDLPVTGDLRVDHPTVEQLWRNTVWSQRSNFVGIPTDCPQRDERLGWMGDAGVFWDAACFNMDVSTFTRRFTGDIRDAQGQDGAFPDFAPNALAKPTFRGDGASPGWADAGVILPWTSWQRYGDTEVIMQNWPAMMKYVRMIAKRNPDHVWRNGRGTDYGDWLALDAKEPWDATTPRDLVGTAEWANSTKLMIEMAAAIDAAEDRAFLEELHQRVIRAFQSAFVKADGTIGNASQTGYILALHYNLLPAGLRQTALAKLSADIRRRGTLLSTGFLGTPYALDVLADGGETELVYQLLKRTQYPSWGYMVAKGATTIWERWNGDVGDVSMNSYNHYALGAVCGFLFRRVGGIEQIEPGFRRFRVRPLPHRLMRRAGADYESVLGRISTDWQLNDENFALSLSVPANATAEVHIPGAEAGRVLEGGGSAQAAEGVKLLRRNGTEAVYEVGSGQYNFETQG